jgi:23S rRNA (adenine2030-N6)-methyltransferase
VNYRHDYHAGNFADVFKHVALRLLLGAMHRKPKPFFYLDTHAACSQYTLDSEAAARTQEWRNGIGRLWHRDDLEASVAAHRALIREWPGNASAAEPRVLPGSTAVAHALLRSQDRAAFCETLSPACHELREAFGGDDRVAIHERDGYEALKALLPPREKRGVVLVDPPFEQPDEFGRLLAGLRVAHERWAQGVFALWYPLKDEAAVARFKEQLATSGVPRILTAELWPWPRDVGERFAGCGLAIVNPPWQVDDQLTTALACLVPALAADPRYAGYQVAWLVGE